MGEAKRKAEQQQLILLDEHGNDPTVEVASDEPGEYEIGDVEEPPAAEPREVTTALLGILEASGALSVTADITVDIVLRRAPTFSDIYAAMTVLSRQPYLTEDLNDNREVETAFLVITERDGQRWATNNINQPLVLDRHPGPTDVEMAAAQICLDITCIQVANATVAKTMEVGSAMAEQQRTAKIMENLAKQGIHLPPGAHKH